jgi:hypothetical protein
MIISTCNQHVRYLTFFFALNLGNLLCILHLEDFPTPTTFQVTNGHVWLVATVLNRSEK